MLSRVCAEITYGHERLAMFIQGVDSIFDLEWVNGVTYGDVFHQNGGVSKYNFDYSDAEGLFTLFDMYEAEAKRLIELGLVLPGYDYVLKCSHVFNLLDARNAISVTERTGYIGRVRALARLAAQRYLAEREQLGFPMLKREVKGS